MQFRSQNIKRLMLEIQNVSQLCHLWEPPSGMLRNGSCYSFSSAGEAECTYVRYLQATTVALFSLRRLHPAAPHLFPEAPPLLRPNPIQPVGPRLLEVALDPGFERLVLPDGRRAEGRACELCQRSASEAPRPGPPPAATHPHREEQRLHQAARRGAAPAGGRRRVQAAAGRRRGGPRLGTAGGGLGLLAPRPRPPEAPPLLQ